MNKKEGRRLTTICEEGNTNRIQRKGNKRERERVYDDARLDGGEGGRGEE